MVIIMLGPQGSGKGTQSELLAKHFKLLRIESGDLLRDLAKHNLRIRKMINNGIIVPSRETLRYIEKFIKSQKHGFDDLIFDGFPRNAYQYKIFKNWIKRKGGNLESLIYLHISRSETVKRLSSRRVCEKCDEVYNLLTKPPKGGVCDLCGGNLVQRDDDQPEVIKKRLQIFEHNTKPIVKLAEKDGILVRVDGERSIETIFKDILGKLKKHDRK